MDEKITFLDMVNLNNTDSAKLMSIVTDKNQPNGCVFEKKKRLNKQKKTNVIDMMEQSIEVTTTTSIDTDTIEQATVSSVPLEPVSNGHSPGVTDANDEIPVHPYISSDQEQYESSEFSSNQYPMQGITPLMHPGPMFVHTDIQEPLNNMFSIPYSYSSVNFVPSYNNSYNNHTPVYSPNISFPGQRPPFHNINRPNYNIRPDSGKRNKNRKSKYKNDIVSENTYMNGGMPDYNMLYMYQGFDPRGHPAYMHPYNIPSVNTTYQSDYNSVIGHYAHQNNQDFQSPRFNTPEADVDMMGGSYTMYPQFIPQYVGNECNVEYNNDGTNFIQNGIVSEENGNECSIDNTALNIDLTENKESFTTEFESLKINTTVESNNVISPGNSSPLKETSAELDQQPEDNHNDILVSADMKQDLEVFEAVKLKSKNKKRKKKKKPAKDVSSSESGNNTRGASPTPISLQTEVNDQPSLAKIEITSDEPQNNDKPCPLTNGNCEENSVVWGKKKEWSNVFAPLDGEKTTLQQLTLSSTEHSLPVPETISEETLHRKKIAGALQNYQNCYSYHQLLSRGLINKSIWCYTNCLLQVLIACPPFLGMMQLLIKEIPKLEILDKFPFLSTIATFVNLYSDVSEVMQPTYKGKGNHTNAVEMGVPCEPLCVYNLLTVGNCHFEERKQQDAQEALNFILNGLHEEIAECFDNNCLQMPNALEDGDEWHVKGPKGKSCVTRTTPFQQTPFSQIFWGEYHSMQTVSGSVSANIQPFNTIQLEVSSPKVKHLRDSFDLMTSKEEVYGYTCSKTNKETTLVKQVQLQVLPKIMILQLNRFIYNSTERLVSKESKRVDFDVEMEIKKELLYQNRTRKEKKIERTYTLFAVVKHEGPAATKGHYICEVNRGGQWLRCDDANIKAITVTDVLQYDRLLVPYLLFYQRNDTLSTFTNGK